MVAIPNQLSNIQLELLKLYAVGVPDEYLIDIKEILAKYLLEKARDEADRVWIEKGYNQDTINTWLGKNKE